MPASKAPDDDEYPENTDQEGASNRTSNVSLCDEHKIQPATIETDNQSNGIHRRSHQDPELPKSYVTSESNNRF